MYHSNLVRLCIRKAGEAWRSGSGRLGGFVRSHDQTGIALLVLLLIARAIYIQYEHPQRESSQVNYGVLFASLYRQDIHNVRVVDAGVDDSENLVNYAPQLRFYRAALGREGAEGPHLAGSHRAAMTFRRRDRHLRSAVGHCRAPSRARNRRRIGLRRRQIEA
jgi:hypothetical protein